MLSFECDSAFDEDIPLDEALELGDIILAPQVIARQAPEFGNSAQDECRLMLVHGMLHLLGYDHIEDDEAEAMEAREDELLRLLAAARGDDPASIEVGPITRHTHELRSTHDPGSSKDHPSFVRSFGYAIDGLLLRCARSATST